MVDLVTKKLVELFMTVPLFNVAVNDINAENPAFITDDVRNARLITATVPYMSRKSLAYV
jgi:hypothetical protein